MGDIKRKKDRRPQGYRPGPFALIYAGLLVAGLAAAAAVYYVLVHHVPGMAKDPTDTVKTALLVIGGSGALAGLYVSYRKQRTDEANHLRDQDKLFTERYTQAAAQLGSDKAAVRLAGVYALARIADDSERDRSTCLEVLCAYLRMPYNPDTAEAAERQVRTTAQTAIGTRLYTNHPGFWSDAAVDLAGAYLIDLSLIGITADFFTAIGATFSGDARFDATTFNGSARFDGATFGGIAAFKGVTFGGIAAFNGATFGGRAWFGRAKFDWGAEFDKATFKGATEFDTVMFDLAARFGGATFSEDARFGGATFSGVASFDGATFNSAYPPAWPEGFAEPAGIIWDPPGPPVAAPDPDSAARPADPSTTT